ncbi:SPOR domain-containing protein [Streptomyces sp. CA-111067]|jgi:hypothetical protein|uniref:SPOR domain-containing protein n=1 Tax=Streptomyces sp. CA-111067 TaxID=3240046 RepID=UPI003D98DADC
MTSDLIWVLIRQDAGGHGYRVGRYATRAEAERVAGMLDGRGRAQERRYVIERVAPRAVQA